MQPHLSGPGPEGLAANVTHAALYISLAVKVFFIHEADHLSVRIVPSIDVAVEHIEKYGSMHTESIITKDYANSQRFLNEVNSSTVLVNASTRFSDGFELGLGAEIGISTTKLHAFGPMGLEELTTSKFIIYGDGQVRK